MKILFIGDYSNLHTTLARELRKMGHTAHVMSDKCGYMDLESDIFIERSPGLRGSFKYLFDLFGLLPKLKDYDVVQLINTNFLKLRPQKIKYFYDRISEQNRSMFLTLAGNDYYYVKACYDARLFRFSEFRIGKEFAPGHLAKPEHTYGWMSHANKLWAEYLLQKINGAMAVLPEYLMPVKEMLGDKVVFTNLPIDFSQLPQSPVHFDGGKVNLVVPMRSGVEEMKGTRILYNIAKEIKDLLPDKVNLDVIKDVSFNEFLRRISKSDIILDQLYAYSPAMTALYGMALWKVVATGAQPEYYESIGYTESKPLFSLSPFDKDIKERLTNLIDNPDEIIRLGELSKEIALKNNDSKLVAERFLKHWESHI